MKKPIRIIGIVMIGIVIRACHVAVHSIGEVGGTKSPDKKFWALGESFKGEKFWGGTYTYYKFRIETTNGDLICHYKLDNPPQPLSNWREDSDKLIIWETNSSSVTYNFNGGYLNLSVKP